MQRSVTMAQQVTMKFVDTSRHPPAAPVEGSDVIRTDLQALMCATTQDTHITHPTGARATTGENGQTADRHTQRTSRNAVQRHRRTVDHQPEGKYARAVNDPARPRQAERSATAGRQTVEEISMVAAHRGSASRAIAFRFLLTGR